MSFGGSVARRRAPAGGAAARLCLAAGSAALAPRGAGEAAIAGDGQHEEDEEDDDDELTLSLSLHILLQVAWAPASAAAPFATMMASPLGSSSCRNRLRLAVEGSGFEGLPLAGEAARGRRRAGRRGRPPSSEAPARAPWLSDSQAGSAA